MKKKRQWGIRLILFILSIGVTILWWFVIEFHHDYQRIPSSHLIGNRPITVAALKEEGFPFSFLVIGDTSGNETAETLIKMAIEKGRASFMIILGDFVKKPDIWNHRFFLTEMTQEIKPPFPVFLVPGNHDIDYYLLKIKQSERRVTEEIYESLYGLRNFDFIFNGCLFIICGPDLKDSTYYLNYLRDTLSQRGKGKKHIFVFLHYPPKGLADHIEGSLPIPNEKEFLSLLKTYHVRACFFGDYHGHWRGQESGVNFIVTGGGGRLKASQPAWGKYNHILKVIVGPDRFDEEVITIGAQVDLEDSFEEMVFTTLFPIIQNSAWILYLIFSILPIISGVLLYQLIKTIRHG